VSVQRTAFKIVKRHLASILRSEDLEKTNSVTRGLAATYGTKFDKCGVKRIQKVAIRGPLCPKIARQQMLLRLRARRNTLLQANGTRLQRTRLQRAIGNQR